MRPTFLHKLVRQVRAPALHRAPEEAKAERDRQKSEDTEARSLIALPRTFDNTGLYPRDLGKDLHRDDSFDILPTNGRVLQDGTIDSKFEYALRRAVKDAFDYFRHHVGWNEKIRTYALVENFKHNEFAKVTCVLCSKPIKVDHELLSMIEVVSGGEMSQMPSWETVVGIDEYDHDYRMSDIYSPHLNFDHKGPRANRIDGTAPPETDDQDSRFNYRACALMTHDRWLIGGRKLLAEALVFAREAVKREPKLTLRALRNQVLAAFQEDMARLYNHPMAVGVSERECNGRDAKDYDRERQQMSQEEVLGEWRLSEHLRSRTDSLRR